MNHAPRNPERRVWPVPLPPKVCQILAHVDVRYRNPSLHLNKLLCPVGNQEQQKTQLESVTRAEGDESLLSDVLGRRDPSPHSWERTTAAPLTLHLARASMLENAGICLHPLYGFAYMPGSGLKGMARAYAETVWLAEQPIQNQPDDWKLIEQVFGWSPNSDFVDKQTGLKPWRPAGLPEHEDSAAGAVIFHDAWPLRWPRLAIDVVNTHHPSYYKHGEPPGDWDDPSLVYFLAVPPGQAFSFCLDKRRADVPDRLLDLARQWLDGALTYAGAGAKTAAGYGGFAPPSGADAPRAEVLRQTWSAAATSAAHAQRAAGGAGIPRCTFEMRLQLVSPAFLAGAEATAADCTLRGATLRGQLRWWWRTMHAAYLDCADLARLEAAIWGSAQTGGAVHLQLQPLKVPPPQLYNFKSGARQAEFAHAHELEDPPDQKTTRGLFYLSYGMDESIRGRPRQRHFLEPPAEWEVRLSARATSLPPVQRAAPPIPAADVLEQSRWALWLLCTFGGVGSKARKGFGSLRGFDGAAAESNLDACRASAAALRRKLGIGRPAPAPVLPTAAITETAPQIIRLATPWTDAWHALDQIGFAYQDFAKSRRHNPEKVALGLPRKIHGPRDDKPIGGQVKWRPAEWLGSQRHRRVGNLSKARFASPAYLHLSADTQGRVTLTIAAFPVADLPDAATSERVLRDLLAHFEKELGERIARGPRPPAHGNARSGPPARETMTPRAGALARRVTGRRTPGTEVRVNVLGPRDGGKPGFKVVEEGRPPGTLLGAPPSEEMPAPGSVIVVYLKDDAQPENIQYQWTRPPAPKPPPRGGRGPRR